MSKKLFYFALLAFVMLPGLRATDVSFQDALKMLDMKPADFSVVTLEGGTESAGWAVKQDCVLVLSPFCASLRELSIEVVRMGDDGMVQMTPGLETIRVTRKLGASVVIASWKSEEIVPVGWKVVIPNGKTGNFVILIFQNSGAARIIRLAIPFHLK